MIAAPVKKYDEIIATIDEEFIIKEITKSSSEVEGENIPIYKLYVNFDSKSLTYD